jgi:3-deoxy-manno-octulosonate cytidylyltransferase (CMP-KDO synthetase)
MHGSNLAIIVPCRLESTRFPRKLLHKIKGQPLLLLGGRADPSRKRLNFPFGLRSMTICWVSARRRRASSALATSGAHQSGTDRMAEG